MDEIQKIRHALFMQIKCNIRLDNKNLQKQKHAQVRNHLLKLVQNILFLIICAT